jgi:F-type H+-transporting ATPase subunit a
MEESLGITNLLNHIFAGPIDALLIRLGIHPDNPAAPIDDTLTIELLVVLAFIALFIYVRATLSVDKPKAPQHFAEIVYGFIKHECETIIGHGSERFQAFIACLFLFILTCNLLGLIPGIHAPTQAAEVPFGLAVAVFIYYNFYGLKDQGLIGYLKHFAGPVWWIAWLLFPIEIVSNLARMMSLTIRLWANMFAGDLVTLVFFSLIPLAIPVLFLALHILVSIVQALVFTYLPMIYLAEATRQEH